MGLLVNGEWVDQWYDTDASGGRFERQEQAFRHWVTADGAPGPSGEGGFAAEWGRYHLYVSYACPWAQRTLIMRAFKGLQEHIRVSVVHWHMGAHGWTFEPAPGVIPDPLFDTLKWLEGILAKRRFLTGNSLTEADIRLFTTLVRFDPVYHGHFKCNIRRLLDYPNLWGYTREWYQHPRINPTVNFHHIRHHYYGSHPQVNPSGVVPAGPDLDFAAPHGRG